MTLRKKFVVAFAAVAIAVAVLVGVISFAVTARTLNSEVDRSLVSAASTLSAGGKLVVPTGTADAAGLDGHDKAANEGIIQTARGIAADGTQSELLGGNVGIPVTAADQALAAPTAKAGASRFQTVTVGEVSYRVLTRALGGSKGAVQVARDVSESSRVLSRLAAGTAVLGLIVAFAAAVAGWLIAHQITRRLTSLTEIAENVSSTGLLDVQIPRRGSDEVSRLGVSMQSMLAELATSRQAQQRLVENAGHELRTPLTSLRTNVAVLHRFAELSPDSRRRLLDDVEGETRELTNAVNELVELAADRRDAEPEEPVDLAALAHRVADLYRRRSGRQIVVDADHQTVLGRPHALERAVSNLLDNAVKFDIDGQEPIVVLVRGLSVTVLDRGPGLTDGADRIFDRFYRAAAARSMPGSGLGLSIVREVASQHGGVVSAVSRRGGGAAIGFTLGDAGVRLAPSLPDPKP